MRNLPEAVTQLLASGQVVLAVLIEFQLDQPLYISANGRYFEHSGKNYIPGLVKNIPSIKSDFSLSANSMSLVFSDCDDELLGVMRNNGHYDKQIDIHLAIINPTDYSLAHVIPSIYRGYCHDMKPSENGSLSVVFKNHMHKFNRKSNRKTNTASQSRKYPNDHIFDELAGSGAGGS